MGKLKKVSDPSKAERNVVSQVWLSSYETELELNKETAAVVMQAQSSCKDLRLKKSKLTCPSACQTTAAATHFLVTCDHLRPLLQKEATASVDRSRNDRIS